MSQRIATPTAPTDALAPLSAKLVVEPAESAITLGSYQQFTAFVIGEDGKRLDVSAAATWSLSDPKTASFVDGKTGQISGAAAGVVTVTVAHENLTAAATLHINEANTPLLSIVPANIVIAVGDRKQFSAQVILNGNPPKDVTQDVTWTSESILIATVSNTSNEKGLAVATGIGQTKLTAVLGELLAEAPLEVTVARPVALEITPKGISLLPGATQQFIVTAIYSDDSRKVVTELASWTSGSAAIATVSDAEGSKGLAKAIAAGKATIDITFAGVAISAEINVTTNLLADITPDQQEGRRVHACFSYDKVKIGAHQCDRAVFDVLFFDAKVGQINLNNSTTGGSVEGGNFVGEWGALGTFSMKTKCALDTCHSDIAYLSLIGEVEDRFGNKKWLKIEQGKIKPNQSYTYQFADFTLSNTELDFGALCTIVKK